MNSAQATAPVGTEWDACAALGRGDKLFLGSGDEDNTHGGAALYAPTKALTARHNLPMPPGGYTSGYHSLPQDNSSGALVARFRRLLGGTAPGGGGYASYYHVRVLGYRLPSSSSDVAELYLAEPVTHITPFDLDLGTPANGDGLRMAGWGKDGAAPDTGSRPLDARAILGKTVLATYAGGDPALVGAIALSGTNPGPNMFDSGSPCLRDVGGGVYKLTGVVTSYARVETIDQFRHDPTFQLDGLYSPEPEPPPLPLTWISPAFDTGLSVEAPTADLSTATTLTVNAITGKATQNQKAVLAFDVSAGAEPIGATLNLTIIGVNGTVDSQIRIRRIRRAGLSALANWNTYDGTNNWGTGGAENTTSDVYTANQITPAAISLSTPADTVYQIGGSDMLAMVAAARADDGILRLLIESTIDADAAVPFYSADYSLPAFRPYMELEREAPQGDGAAGMGCGVIGLGAD